jgi:hypothetical protein
MSGRSSQMIRAGSLHLSRRHSSTANGSSSWTLINHGQLLTSEPKLSILCLNPAVPPVGMSIPAFAWSASCSLHSPSSSSITFISRRAALLRVAALAATCAASPVAAAIQYGKPSTSDLLHKMDRERPEDEVNAEKAARAEARHARLAKQNELQAEADRRRAAGAGAAEADENAVEIEANLRANYYSPTARRRYVPKIRRSLEDIPRIEHAVRDGRWDEVAASVVDAGTLDDLVLPMRLYASSLSGQGLSLAAKFAVAMGEDADCVERQVECIRKAVKSRRNKQKDVDRAAVLAALTEIRSAIGRYRLSGKLEADDFGIGEIPTDARVGAALGNNNPILYSRNYQQLKK